MTKVKKVQLYEVSIIKALGKGLIRGKEDLNNEKLKNLLPKYHNLLVNGEDDCLYEVDLKQIFEIKRMTKKVVQKIQKNFELNHDKIIGLEIECTNGDLNQELIDNLKTLLFSDKAILVEYKSDLIKQESSYEEIKLFCHEFQKILRDKLIEHGYTKAASLEPFKIRISYRGCGDSWNLNTLSLKIGCCYNDNNSFYTKKRLKDDPVIGEIYKLTFQEYIITLLAESFSWKANYHINGRYVRAHGEEFKEICRVLRTYTNSLLSEKVKFRFESQ